jgi:hypothetical protein
MEMPGRLLVKEVAQLEPEAARLVRGALYLVGVMEVVRKPERLELVAHFQQTFLLTQLG